MWEPARDQNLMPAQRSAFRMRFLLHSAPNLMHCGAIKFCMTLLSRACAATQPTFA